MARNASNRTYATAAPLAHDRNRSKLVGGLVIALLGAALVLSWKLAGAPGFTEMHRSAPGVALKEWTYYPLYKFVLETVLNPLFWIVFAGILLVEKLFPAKRGQKIFSVGFAQDLVWFVFSTTIGVTLTVAWVGILKGIYAEHLSFLTFEPIRALPSWLRFVWAVVLADFLRWVHHWIRHKVPLFWHFHAVHHSQKEMNLFTQFRYHALEYIIARTISTFPMLMLAFDVPVIIAWSIFHMWFTRFYHANIRANLGPLRYVFVTPQSHRIHHSCMPEHRDKNYGVLFSFWDRLFGTQVEEADVYPETGIPDADFPLERKANPVSLLATPVAQHVYPFRAIWRDWRAKKHDLAEESSRDAGRPDSNSPDAR